MSAFARLDAIAGRTMVAVHADRYTLKPKKTGADVNAAPSADTDRPVVTGVLGIYREMPAPISIPNAYDRQTDRRPGVATSIPTIEIDPRQQPPGFVDARLGDILVEDLGNGVSGKAWKIAKATSDEMGRIHAGVNLLS